MLKKYAYHARLTKLSNLEPYYEDSVPWTRALKGKKVLVVHPFSETIKDQYEKKIKIWDSKEILPEFELITFKAVQTMCGEKDERFANWLDALNYMKQAAYKSYSKKGNAIVELNYKAIDRGAEGLVEIAVKPEWANLPYDSGRKLTGDEYFDKHVAPINHLEGYDLPVSAFTKYNLLDGATSLPSTSAGFIFIPK